MCANGIGDVCLYSIYIRIRRKVREISGICFRGPIWNRELTRATFRIACVAYARVRSWKPFRASLRADLHDTILSHATSSRQAYDMTYDCRSVLKHVLKCYDIFSDVHNNRKSCRGPVVSRCRMRQKSYRVNRPEGPS